MNSEWGKKFKEALDMKTVALAVLILWTVGEKLWGYIEMGAKAEFQADVAETFAGDAFYNAVDSVFVIKIKDPETLNEILNSEEVTKFSEEAGVKVRNAIIEDVMKKDTNKISMRSFIGMKTGLRDEDVLPALAKLMKAWENGELMTKAQADAYITGQIKKQVKPGSLKPAQF